MRLTPNEFAAFEQNVKVTSAAFRPDRPDQIVGEGEYAGLMISTEGMFRIALDKRNNSLVVFYSKVASNLKGEFDKARDEARPTGEGLRYSYGVSALRVEVGKELLLPHSAQHFQKAIKVHKDRIRGLNTEHLNIYGMRTNGRTIWANKRVGYVIDEVGKGEDRYDVRVILPNGKSENGFLPDGMAPKKMATLLQRQLAKGVSLAEAHDIFTKDWQDVTSRIWDGRDVHAGRKMGGKLSLTKVKDYLTERSPTMLGGFLVAATFLAIKDHKLSAAIGALAAAHVGADITFHDAQHRWGQRLKAWRDPRDPERIDSYGDGEAIEYYLENNASNLKKVARHIDLEKSNADDFRFLTLEELSNILPAHTDFAAGLTPASIESIAVSASRRGFSPLVTYPAPNTQLEAFQSGMVVLKHALGQGKMLMFVTDREDACLSEAMRLSNVYTAQINEELGKRIRRIEYNSRYTGNYNDSFDTTSVTWEDMETELDGLLYATPKNNGVYLGEIAPSFQKEGFGHIEAYYNHDNKGDNPDLRMSGKMPLAPSYRCLS